MTDYGFSHKGLHIAGTLVMSWEEIDQERNLFRFSDSVLVKTGFSYGRITDLYDEGIYTKEQWSKIKSALGGTTAFFSDFAGKHSQTDVSFWDNVDLVEIYDHKEIVDFHTRYGMAHSNLDIIQGGIEQAIENGEIDEDLNKL